MKKSITFAASALALALVSGCSAIPETSETDVNNSDTSAALESKTVFESVKTNKIDQYGNVPENSISESIKLGAPGSDFIDVNISGTLPATDNYLEFSILPDYNLSKCAAFGITDLEVYGC